MVLVTNERSFATPTYANLGLEDLEEEEGEHSGSSGDLNDFDYDYET
jgi:hypothetical protein